MTTKDERFRALKYGKKLLEDLCDPGKTPRVPGIVRERARGVLRHYPTDYDLERIANSCPELLDTELQSTYTNSNQLYKGKI